MVLLASLLLLALAGIVAVVGLIVPAWRAAPAAWAVAGGDPERGKVVFLWLPISTVICVGPRRQ
jgi:hypothetical protein